MSPTNSLSFTDAPEYKLTKLRNLLGQPEREMSVITKLWVSQLELAESRNERAIITMLLKMLERVSFDLPTELQVYLLYGRAVLLNLEEENAKAADLYQQALDFLTASTENNEGFDRVYLFALLRIKKGLMLLSQDKIAEAEALLLPNFVLVREKGHRTIEALALFGLGSIAVRKGELALALNHLQTALAIFRETHNILRIADVLNSLGQVYNFQNRYQDSIRTLEECISLRTAMGNSRDLGRTYASLGSAYYRLGQYNKCADAIKLAYALFKQNNNRTSTIIACLNLAISYFESNQAEKALPYAQEGVEITRSLNDGLLSGSALAVLAKCLALRGEGQSAKNFLQETLAMAPEVEKRDINNSGTFYSHVGQALLLLAENEAEFQQALSYVRLALSKFTKLGDLDTQLRITGIPAKIILDNLVRVKDNFNSEAVGQILGLWWEKIQQAPENKTLDYGEYLIKYGHWLRQSGNLAQSYQVYGFGLPKLTPPISAQANLTRGGLLAKIAEIAPPTDKKSLLEKAQLFLKKGNAPSARQKEISKLLKDL
jgi:tetratricopeptide (TPR) repeat protein